MKKNGRSGRLLGSTDVKNFGVLSANPLIKDSTSPGHRTVEIIAAKPDITAGHISPLRIGPISEKVWLDMVVDVMIWAFMNNWQEALSVKLTNSIHHFASKLDPTIQLDLRIYQEALGSDFKWSELVNGLLALLTKAAGDEGWRTKLGGIVKCEDVTIATVSFADRNPGAVERYASEA